MDSRFARMTIKAWQVADHGFPLRENDDVKSLVVDRSVCTPGNDSEADAGLGGKARPLCHPREAGIHRRGGADGVLRNELAIRPIGCRYGHFLPKKRN